MLKEITDDDQLERLLSTKGFLVNVDYPTKDVKLHRVDCKFCDPRSAVGIKPSSKRLGKTGEFWYSDNRKEANSKAEQIATRKSFNYSPCTVCKP